MAICKFPMCTRIANEHGLCIPHRIYKDSGIPDPKPEKSEIPEIPVKKKKPGIAKKSAKQKDLDKILKKMATEARKGGLYDCEIHSEVCQGNFDGWHHKQKKTRKNYTDRANLLRSCNPCNTFLETHPQWGIDNGFITSKFKKP